MSENKSNKTEREIREKISSLEATIDWFYLVSGVYGGFTPLVNTKTEKRFTSNHNNITLLYNWQNSIQSILMDDIFELCEKRCISGVSITQIVHKKREFSNGLKANIIEALNYNPALIHECLSIIDKSRGMGG